MKPVISIILIVLAGLVFFFYVDPKYDDVKVLQEEEDRFDAALERSQELIALRDALLSKYNSFSSDELDRLEKLLPDNVDNVRLILDLDGIAKNHGLSLQNVNVSQIEASNEANDDSSVNSIEAGLTVIAPYDTFQGFLRDLEDSLRVIDITSISISTSGSDLDDSTYTLGMRTYWLD